MVSMRFSGGRDIERALRELGGHAVSKRLGRRALKGGAEPVRDKAKRLAPKDERVLEEAIVIGTRVSSRARASVGREQDGIVRVFVGIDQGAPQEVNIYSIVQEFEQPYFRPAWDTEGRKAPDRMGPIIWDDIERTAARLRKRTRAAG